MAGNGDPWAAPLWPYCQAQAVESAPTDPAAAFWLQPVGRKCLATHCVVSVSRCAWPPTLWVKVGPKPGIVGRRQGERSLLHAQIPADIYPPGEKRPESPQRCRQACSGLKLPSAALYAAGGRRPELRWANITPHPPRWPPPRFGSVSVGSALENRFVQEDVMADTATGGLQWEASLASGDTQYRRSGLDYGPGPGWPGDDCADARADGDGRCAGTGMADGMAARFDRLREAAAAHDTSELNDIATLS